MAVQVVPSETTTTTVTKYRPPQPRPRLLDLNSDAALVGIAAGVAYLLTLRRAPNTPPPAPIGSTGPTTGEGNVAPSGIPMSPPLSPPGAPTDLRELGATAHSVLVAASPVTGAIEYVWREYGTDLVLTRSPTNVAVIDGLQSNSTYEVYVQAVGYGGVVGPPSVPLLISTTAGGPSVYVTQPQTVRVVLQLLTTPGLTTGSTGSTGTASGGGTPTTPTTPQTPPGPVTVSAPAAPVPVGQSAALTATLANAPSDQTIQWTWQVTGPTGSLPGGVTTGGATTQFSFPVNAPGTYTVTATAIVNGQTISGTATVTGAAVVQKPTSVTLTGPGSGVVGQPITVQAQATGVARAVYQFWYLPPGGAPSSIPSAQNGWIQSGSYSLNNTFTFTPTVPGEYTVVAYARSVNAPSGETPDQRAIYETTSNLLDIIVSGSTASSTGPSATGSGTGITSGSTTGATPTGGSLYQQAASGALNGQLSPAQALTLARAGKIPGPGFVVVVPGQGPVWYQNLNQIPPHLRPLAAVNSGEVATAVSVGVSATGQGGQSSYIQDVLHGSITPSAQVSGSQQAQYAALYQRLGIIPSLQQLSSARSEIQAEQQGIRALQQAGASPQAIENYLVQLYGYSPQIAAEEVAQGFPVLQQNPNQYS
jgi:hypothetical protein